MRAQAIPRMRWTIPLEAGFGTTAATKSSRPQPTQARGSILKESSSTQSKKLFAVISHGCGFSMILRPAFSSETANLTLPVQLSLSLCPLADNKRPLGKPTIPSEQLYS